MRKLFTLLTLLLCAVSGAWADSMSCSANLSSVTSSNRGGGSANGTNCTITWYKINSGTTVFNNITYWKFDSGTYAQLKLTSGSFQAGDVLKLNMGNANTSSTKEIGFVLSSGNGNKASVTKSTTTDISYTLTAEDIEDDGSIKISRGGAAASDGRFYSFSVTGTRIDKLSAPEISFNSTTLSVTIGSVANATKVTYTTDGTDPTASSTTYSAPFVVDDGTTVKAIAIGDGTTYANSNVASTTVYAAVDIATPVIKEVNGTVAITCTTPGATIKYTTDNWTSETTYTKAFTLSADATVKAKAIRTGSEDSGVATADVTVVTNTKTKTLKMGYGSFTASSDNKTLTGKSGDDAEGFTLTFSDDSKTWGSGDKFTSPINKTAIKNSNGAASILTMPDNIAATKLTLYSYVNLSTASAGDPCGWKSVGGVSYESGDTDYKNIPMGTFNDTEDRLTNQDVRVYPLNNVTGTLSFTSAGGQMCFVLELDVIEYVKTMKVQYKSGNTLIKEESIDVTPLTKQVGMSETIPFRMYIEKDGALYQTTKESSNPWYGKSTTLTKNTVLERSVTPVDLNGGTVELIEDFDLDGSNNNAGIRASNCSAYNNTAYTSTNDLPAGTYNFIVKAYSRGRGSSVKVGETKVFDISEVGESWTDKTFENVIVPADGKLTFVAGGSSSYDPIDILIAIRTGDATVPATITNAGWATLYTPYALDFSTLSDDLTAYTASVSSGTVTLTSVQNVPANTGVVLKGTAKDYSIPVAASSETAKGDLQGSTADLAFDDFEANNSYYVLAMAADESGDVQFRKVTSGTIEAGKAYLKVATAGAKALTVVFADDVTGISNVNAAEFAQPTKRIVKGQLVIEKNGKRYNAAGAEF